MTTAADEIRGDAGAMASDDAACDAGHDAGGHEGGRRAEPVTLPDDRFIPLRPEDLAERIAADVDAFGAVTIEARAVYAAIDRVIGQEVDAFSRELDARYAAFNPDRETQTDQPVDADDAGHGPAEGALLGQLWYLLEKCSFERLEDPQIEAALSAANSFGMRVRVDAEMVEWVHLFVRGRGRVTRARIQWRNLDWRRPWRGRPVEFEVFKRLAVAVRLKGEHAVRLKLFRDIPIQDLEALLPHARVGMTRFDQVRVIGGGAGALGGVVFKLPVVIAGGLAALASIAGALVLALLGFAVKGAMGYHRTKKNRESQRTRHLYDQNMANNASVLHALLMQVRREEVKEALLAYCLLASGRSPGACEAAFDRHAEDWLRRSTRCEINFDHADALETIERLGLWEDRSRGVVVPPERAVAILEEHWRSCASEGYHASAASADAGLGSI